LAKKILILSFCYKSDYYFLSQEILVQRLGLRTVEALDVRNQCSGFIYALSIADQYIKTECINFGNRFSTFNGVRYDITWSWCIGNFGDGAGAAVLSRERDLSTTTTFRGQHIILKTPE
jgi:3-oxoacyl-[acyl-carrier-protein] synthase-3